MNIYSFVEKEYKHAYIKKCFMCEYDDVYGELMVLAFSFDSVKLNACNSVKPKDMTLLDIEDEGASYTDEDEFFIGYNFKKKDNSKGRIDFYFNQYGEYLEYGIY